MAFSSAAFPTFPGTAPAFPLQNAPAAQMENLGARFVQQTLIFHSF
jgi:hypothetical protein